LSLFRRRTVFTRPRPNSDMSGVAVS
jgi:hypothetical protein